MKCGSTKSFLQLVYHVNAHLLTKNESTLFRRPSNSAVRMQKSLVMPSKSSRYGYYIEFGSSLTYI